ncbi:hypothetical protein [Leptolinea tardivitalis]|uniref:Zinc-finger domain-containing protein n=1 Tax=Leptolinea tardivitalis TaxID=229920 RepID=A0A0N8GKR8_9CHLR|nr:hypothetical protein [Leptolinea tardivitalis]KPL70458.1 hypothetical protein ADM99_15075 [Leptolinea tardivitalis]GAP22044.1 hypothetical protein LTAR_02262 [Leptolinea tardivitalis]
MTARLSDHDWEILSAYADHAVSDMERQQIENRIRQDAEFLQAYQSLLRVKGLLHEVPDVKRRRNFYLTPEMVHPHGWLWLIPMLNFSSAAAALLAVIFFLLDLFPLAARPSAAPMALQALPPAQAVVTPTQENIGEETAKGIIGIPTLTVLNTAESEKLAIPGTAPDKVQEYGMETGAIPTEIVTEAWFDTVPTEIVPSTDQNTVAEAAPPQAAAVPMLKSGPSVPEAGTGAVIVEDANIPGNTEVPLPEMRPSTAAAPKEQTALSPVESANTPTAEIRFLAKPESTRGGKETPTAAPTVAAAQQEIQKVEIKPTTIQPSIETQKPVEPVPFNKEAMTLASVSYGVIFLMAAVILGFIGYILKKKSTL